MLYSKCGGQISFVGVIPFTISSQEISDFRTDYHISFSIVQDTLCRMSKRYKINVVPEAVLKDGADVVYQGVIDNSYVAIGKINRAARKNYLEEAIIAGLKNEKTKVSVTEPVGCFIKCAQ